MWHLMLYAFLVDWFRETSGKPISVAKITEFIDGVLPPSKPLSKRKAASAIADLIDWNAIDFGERTGAGQVYVPVFA